MDNADNNSYDFPRSCCWDHLTQALPFEKKEQLAHLILGHLAAGWGALEIEFKDHHTKEFREVNAIPTRRSVNREDGKPVKNKK